MTDAYDSTIKQLEAITASGNPYWNIDKPTALFLQSIIVEHRYTSALEIGTSNGLSALYLAAALAKTGGTLVTVESHAERFALAMQHFEHAGVTDIITQVKGHAPEVLDDIAGNFDFIFIDATSVEYHLYFTHLKSRLVTGGTLVADNILSHQEKIQNFVDAIRQDTDFSVSIESVGKGLLIAQKIH